jgi:hypothetical protein
MITDLTIAFLFICYPSYRPPSAAVLSLSMPSSNVLTFFTEKNGSPTDMLRAKAFTNPSPLQKTDEVHRLR